MCDECEYHAGWELSIRKKMARTNANKLSEYNLSDFPGKLLHQAGWQTVFVNNSANLVIVKNNANTQLYSNTQYIKVNLASWE